MNGITGKQASYLEKLMETTLAPNETDLTVAAALRLLGAEPADAIARLTLSEASEQIDYYVHQPKIEKLSEAEAPVGIHLLNENVYKVQIAKTGSGKKYAKRLSEKINGKPQWVYEGRNGAFIQLNDKTLMTLDEAKEFGIRTGTCAVCGRELTVEESVVRGIGPVCATRF